MVNMEWVKEQARPGGFDDAAPVKKLEGHAFCTGHTYMGGTNAIFFAEAADREFSSEYAQVHGMKTPKGPGRAHQPDWRSKRRPGVDLPHSGPPSGERLPRDGKTDRYFGRYSSSSSAVGQFWNDPLFKDTEVPLPEKPSIGLGATSSSAYGAFIHDQSTFKTQKDDNMALLRATNGIRRLLPEEENSQFALEDLPVADRIL